jgi:hypothetical protein
MKGFLADINVEVLVYVSGHIWQTGLGLIANREHERVNKIGSRQFARPFNKFGFSGSFINKILRKAVLNSIFKTFGVSANE